MEKCVAIIGGGWYGCHIALTMKKAHPLWKVVIYEKNVQLLNEISGNFGIRLHAGPHYPRSPATRHDCHKGFVEFRANYNELINDHKYSIYGLGNCDANGEKSKVNCETFAAVCKEFGNSAEIDPGHFGFINLDYAANIDEPSIAVGPRLRSFFMKHLIEIGVELFVSTEVMSVARKGNDIVIETQSELTFKYDNVINASGFKSLIPRNGDESLPLNMEVVYQICLAFLYRHDPKLTASLLDKTGEMPWSFIVMDGWFPCVMPYDDRVDTSVPISKYMVTNGKWTILGSYRTREAAEEAFTTIDRHSVETTVKNCCEKELLRFFPNFFNEFEYDSLIMKILPKIKTDREFRSAVTFQDARNELIHIVPGKVNNIFDAEREVFAYVESDIGRTDDRFIHENHWRYIKGGTLHDAAEEIKDKVLKTRNTCNLQTYVEVLNLQ